MQDKGRTGITGEETGKNPLKAGSRSLAVLHLLEFFFSLFRLVRDACQQSTTLRCAPRVEASNIRGKFSLTFFCSPKYGSPGRPYFLLNIWSRWDFVVPVVKKETHHECYSSAGNLAYAAHSRNSQINRHVHLHNAKIICFSNVSRFKRYG